MKTKEGLKSLWSIVCSSLMKGGGVDGKAPYRTREAYIWGLGGTVVAAAGTQRGFLIALKAESKAAKAAAAAQPAADEGDAPPAADEGGAPLPVAVSLACVGCGRLPSDMDDEREKHPVCHKCRKLKLPTTYWCCVNCPGNPGASLLHIAYHKEEKQQRKAREDGGVAQQRARELAERQTWEAAQTGDEYGELLAEGIRYDSQEDWRRAARTFREAIALRPDRPAAYFNLGAALDASGHEVEAAQRYLEAKERHLVGSEYCGHRPRQRYGSGLRHATAERVRRGGQAGVVERRGAQGAVGEGREGGAERCGSQQNAGYRAVRESSCLGGGASLSSGAQAGGHALRAGCGAL